MPVAPSVLLAFAGLLAGCAAPSAAVDAPACDDDGALAACSAPTQSADYYADVSSWYFDTMDTTAEDRGWPPYGETIARWEWPPWLKLTAYTREGVEVSDTLLQLFPSTVTDRDCRGFDTQPFGRCRVVFHYAAYDDRPCPIYEEFTFNDAGEVTWIEAWSDLDGLRPTPDDDPWGEAGTTRLSARIPGLGTATGALDLDSPAMTAAAEADVDVADFVVRARDWYAAWLAEAAAAPGDMWEVGCGW